MKPSHLRTLLASIVMMASWGCGDLSNDGLAYVEALPKSDELALVFGPDNEGTDQALIGLLGEPAVYQDVAVEIGTAVGSALEGTLDFLQGFEELPSELIGQRRIWGPFKNVDDKGMTIRFEISRRLQTETQEPTLLFCLHAARDEEFGEELDPNCELTGSAGLRTLIWGQFTPSGSSDRSGIGKIIVDFESARYLDPTTDGPRGFLFIDYNFDAEVEAREIEMSWRGPISATQLYPQSFDYRYERSSSGEARFSFEVLHDVVEGDDEAVEILTVASCWEPTGAGRAEAAYFGGDVGPQWVTASECWDERSARLFYEAQAPLTDWQEREGDIASCSPCEL